MTPAEPGRLAVPELVIDLHAIRHNVRFLASTVAPAALMVVVKADGYGHGALEVARAAREAGAPWLGVATLDEALGLRAAGDTGRILCWLDVPSLDPDRTAAAVAADLDLTAYSVRELRSLADRSLPPGRPVTHSRPTGHALPGDQSRAPVRPVTNSPNGSQRPVGKEAATGGQGASDRSAVSERPVRVQLKVDTGLSRGGAPRGEWAELFAEAAALEAAGQIEVTGIWSHFAASDDPGHPANASQKQAFEDAVRMAEDAGLDPEVCHLANSAGALLHPDARHDLVRCGIAVYGLDPAPGHTPPEIVEQLRPAMTAQAPLALVKPVDAGDGVSYGHTWTAAEHSTLGLVPVGYGDGIPRHASNRAEVEIDGRRRPVRGRVCMDQFMVDLGGERPEVGSGVVLFGPGSAGEPTVQDWAEACDTISYEIVTRIGGRFRRRYADDGEDAR